MTPADLIAFEDEVAALFNAGRIRAPVHLAGGNEAQLLEIFSAVEPEDWIFCSWRSHYHCLLKGVPRAELLAEIVAGRSIALSFPKYRVMSSAIVGGVLPIAVGCAMGLKRAGSLARVHVFVGDMTQRTGIYQECARYAVNHHLPMRFVIEDDNRSVCTDTRAAWGETLPAMLDGAAEFNYYRYQPKYPHAGSGKRIEF